MPYGRWTHNAADGLEDILRISSIEIELSLSEIYERVEFEEKNLEEREF